MLQNSYKCNFSEAVSSAWKYLLANLHDPAICRYTYRQHSKTTCVLRSPCNTRWRHFVCIVLLHAVHQRFYDDHHHHHQEQAHVGTQPLPQLTPLFMILRLSPHHVQADSESTQIFLDSSVSTSVWVGQDASSDSVTLI